MEGVGVECEVGYGDEQKRKCGRERFPNSDHEGITGTLILASSINEVMRNDK